jgi:hypothetical protein
VQGVSWRNPPDKREGLRDAERAVTARCRGKVCAQKRTYDG